MASEIRLILFDFDGTLADSFDIVLQSINELSDGFNYKKIKNNPSLRKKHMKQIIDDLGISMLRFPFYVRKLKELVFEKMHGAFLFKGVSPLIKKLHKNYVVG
ncbi:HAD hydrolase-like protein, partial [Candidatus Woesearchaeota archaeon]|nr:HAD hydrolase-like protein [Candidatus Woesearchaeota archaeon]